MLGFSIYPCCSVSVFQAEAPGPLCECSARFKEGARVCFPLHISNKGLVFYCGKSHKHKNILLANSNTVVSRVSAHGRSTITSRFSVYWALTWDTGRLPCVKLK